MTRRLKEIILFWRIVSLTNIATVICKNSLRIGFRNEYFTFTSQNEVDLDDLHILKIGFKIGLGIGSENFPQNFPEDFPQNFPEDFLQNFLQDFLQNFLQHFPQIFKQDFPQKFLQGSH